MFGRHDEAAVTTAAEGGTAQSPWVTAKQEARFDTEMAAQLRMSLAGAFAEARNWRDLARALRQKGFYLRQEEGRVRLRDVHSGADICSCKFLGFPSSELEARFGAPLPSAGARAD
ncbi:hypothetical protein ACUXV3_12675 [Roseobacteraceae bacterium NS-SX3]